MVEGVKPARACKREEQTNTAAAQHSQHSSVQHRAARRCCCCCNTPARSCWLLSLQPAPSAQSPAAATAAATVVFSLSPARTRARWPADDGAVSGTALLTCVCTTVWWRSPEHRVGLVGEGCEYAHQHARTHACTSPTPTNTHCQHVRGSPSGLASRDLHPSIAYVVHQPSSVLLHRLLLAAAAAAAAVYRKRQ